ncbi:MAG: MetQ/NlpA family ABC transporter substrate-binding protein [Merdibacter sp.]
MKKLLSGALALALCATLAGCGSSNSDDKTLMIGASITPHAEILNNIKPDLEEMGYTVNIVEFSDYVKPNTALEDGELDANYFQHNQYLEEWNEKNGTNLVSAGDIHFEPMGIYSDKYTALDDLKEGQHVTIGIPNDATNGGRALQLLAANGIITLKDDLGITATPNDILDSPYDVEIVEMAAESIPVNLSDMDLGVANGNNALNANVLDKLIVTEDAGGVAQQFANVIAVRDGEQDSQKIKDLLSVLKSQKTIDFINEKYDGIVVPFFTVEGE